MNYEITEASQQDFDNGIWPIFQAVIASGDTYIYPSDTTKEKARNIWFETRKCYVVKEQPSGKIIATYTIRPNLPGLASHIANAGFMVHPDYRDKKIGQKMCEHALKQAKQDGYLAMQFNVVVSTNEKAVKLWQKMGFKIIGTVPQAFKHATKGLVDVHIMHRFL